jgi:N-acetylglucosaminyldiphosphoundecaprenol N-acetyl-beta-D-mannosaminyltransferase
MNTEQIARSVAWPVPRQTVSQKTASDGVPVYAMMGIRVGAFDLARINASVAEAISEQRQVVIANHNLHSLYLHGRDAKLRAFHEAADITHADGMSLVFIARILGIPLSRCHRVTYVDWIGPLMEEAARNGWRVFALGGRPGVFNQAAAQLRERFPGLVLEGMHGYFDASPGSGDTATALRAIAAFRPQILLVGMGMPRQEHWVLDNRHALRANAILMAGAAMDYVAGVVPTPSRRASALGLEWLWRLLAEPRRLWRRYLVEPWYVLVRLPAEWLVHHRDRLTQDLSDTAHAD